MLENIEIGFETNAEVYNSSGELIHKNNFSPENSQSIVQVEIRV
jgi:hypothetical protein